MKMRNGLAVLVVGMFVSSALAICPPSNTSEKGAELAKANAATTGCDCPNCDGSCDLCKKAVKTVAAKTAKKGGCGSKRTATDATVVTASAKTAKKGGCGSRKAATAATVVTVSDKTASGCGCSRCDGNCPLCMKAAKTVAAKTAKKGGCGYKKAGTATTVVTAADKSAKSAKSGKKGCCASKSGAKTVAAGSYKGCHTQKRKTILASMPALQYRVGETTTGCSQSAAAMAKASDAKIEYLVGDDAFPNKGEALVKLASAIDAHSSDLMSMQFSAGGECSRCPVTAKAIAKKNNTTIAYRVGGFDFDTREKAQRAITLARAAAESVAMEYKVGEKLYQCGKSAGAKADSSKATMTFVIGDKETCCDKTAAVMLAEAKVEAVVDAVAAYSTGAPAI